MRNIGTSAFRRLTKCVQSNGSFFDRHRSTHIATPATAGLLLTQKVAHTTLDQSIGLLGKRYLTT